MFHKAKLINFFILLIMFNSSLAAFFSDKEARVSIDKLKEQNNILKSSITSQKKQIDQLIHQNQDINGNIEILEFKLSKAVKEIEELSKRLVELEPKEIKLDGNTFFAKKEETDSFNRAIHSFKQSDFNKAIHLFQNFISANPNSGYNPSAIFWLSTSYYINNNYEEAILQFNKLITNYPNFVKIPDALLAVANSQIALKDINSAKNTLNKLINTYPNSQSAQEAKQRLQDL